MTVHGLPLEQIERYVDRRELAALMGVSVTTIHKFVREGMPSVRWGARTRRFRPSLAIAWANSRQFDVAPAPGVCKDDRNKSAPALAKEPGAGIGGMNFDPPGSVSSEPGSSLHEQEGCTP